MLEKEKKENDGKKHWQKFNEYDIIILSKLYQIEYYNKRKKGKQIINKNQAKKWALCKKIHGIYAKVSVEVWNKMNFIQNKKKHREQAIVKTA